MSQLEKAKLQEIDKNDHPKGNPDVVQFNPASLKLKLTNSIEGGQSRGRQRRQHNAKSSTVLTVELIFDSADEDNNGKPVSVRSKTAMIEKYLLPLKEGGETPPKVRFEWNEFIVTGIVENLDLEFDLFAADGTPLRAKTTLTIKEQDPKYMALKNGPGGRNSRNSSRPGQRDKTPSSDRSAAALDGETPPEFAARQGFDPAAWRGLDVDLSAGLSLGAGVEVGFSPGLSASAGIGVSAGLQAGSDLSLEATVGLEAEVRTGVGGSVAAGLDANTSAGLAMAAAGGMQAAIETVKIAHSREATGQARQAFASPPAATSAGRGESGNKAAPDSSPHALAIARVTTSDTSPHSREPLHITDFPTATQRQTTPPRPAPPKADLRSVSYGVGVPLRPTVSAGSALAPIKVCGNRRILKRSEGEPPFRLDPTTPPWVALPKNDRGREVADKIEARKRIRPCASPCHCLDIGGKR